MESTKDKVTNKLGCRIAQERQLLTEEKWIINTLKKIKNQRNCLQIERLQLESLKSQMKQKDEKTKQPDSPKNVDISQVSAVNLMQSQSVSIPAAVMFPDIPMAEVTCNEEALDLSITNSVFANLPQSADFMAEIEEDDEDDECEADNIMLDIDMLMNADK